MDTKTEPWGDDFADGSVTDDGLSSVGTWTVVGASKAAQNTSSGSTVSLYRTVNDDNIEFRYTYSIDSYSSGTPLVDAHFRYNTTSGERLLVRFQPDRARLYYYNGSAWSTPVDNTGVTTATGTKYKVRIEADGGTVKVWRSPASGGAETLVFNQSSMPTYNGNRLQLAVSANTVASLDDIMIFADDSGLNRSTTLTYRDNNEVNQVTDYNGAASYTFDAWGRTSTEAKNGVTRTYSWTNANLLAGINSSDTNEVDVTYAYTGDMKRGWRLENGSLANYYTWDVGFNVIGEEAVGLARKAFVPGLAEVVGNNLSSSADYHYLTTDHLGSTRGMWNGSITQTGSWESTPYGSAFNFAGPADVTHLFAGLDLDRVTGQNFGSYRYMNASIGAWTSRDPVESQSNLYNYVGGMPTRYVDPKGLFLQSAPAVSTSIAGGGAGALGLGGLAILGIAVDLHLIMEDARRAKQIWDEWASVQEENAKLAGYWANKKEYKDICDEKTPVGLNPCAFNRWRLDNRIRCKEAMKRFGEKWFKDVPDPWNHDLAGIENEIEKYRKKVDDCEKKGL